MFCILWYDMRSIGLTKYILLRKNAVQLRLSMIYANIWKFESKGTLHVLLPFLCKRGIHLIWQHPSPPHLSIDKCLEIDLPTTPRHVYNSRYCKHRDYVNGCGRRILSREFYCKAAILRRRRMICLIIINDDPCAAPPVIAPSAESRILQGISGKLLSDRESGARVQVSMQSLRMCLRVLSTITLIAPSHDGAEILFIWPIFPSVVIIIRISTFQQRNVRWSMQTRS